MKTVCNFSIDDFSRLVVKKAGKDTLKIEYEIKVRSVVLSSLKTKNMQFGQSQYLASNSTEMIKKLRRQISLDIAKKYAKEKETYLQNQSQKLEIA